MGRSLAGGEIVPVAADAPATLCDALQTPRVSPITFGILRSAGDALSVSEAEVEAAVRFAFERHGLVVEPGGAVALAACSPARSRRGGHGACLQAGISTRRFTRGSSGEA